MIYISNKSDTLIIVIHEIYGVNAHMRQTCERLSKQGYDVICPNLLKRAEAFTQQEEVVAYTYFMNELGFESAVRQVKRLIDEKKQHYKKIGLLGFSIGATIAWQCSEETKVDGIVGYYGSRIREYLHVVPECPVLLFFPKEERSFSIDHLLTRLVEKKIQNRRLNAYHGWMNQYDRNYNKDIAQQTLDEMNGFFSSILKD